MENEILLETEELLQRLVEAVEKLNSAPSEDTIIAFFALVAAWITIAFLLVERSSKYGFMCCCSAIYSSRRRKVSWYEAIVLGL